jgi:hypothetical protein
VDIPKVSERALCGLSLLRELLGSRLSCGGHCGNGSNALVSTHFQIHCGCASTGDVTGWAADRAATFTAIAQIPATLPICIHRVVPNLCTAKSIDCRDDSSAGSGSSGAVPRSADALQALTIDGAHDCRAWDLIRFVSSVTWL